MPARPHLHVQDLLDVLLVHVLRAVPPPPQLRPPHLLVPVGQVQSPQALRQGGVLLCMLLLLLLPGGGRVVGVVRREPAPVAT